MIDKVARRGYIKEKCLKGGEFIGFKKTIIKLSGGYFKWSIVHEDQFGKSSECYENLEEAVYDFVELEEVYG